MWVDRQGHEEAIKAAPGRAYVAPRLSPDGTRVALDIRDQENDIWVWDFARETLTRVTSDPGSTRRRRGLPDGRRLVFSSQADGDAGVSLLASGRRDRHCGASDAERRIRSALRRSRRTAHASCSAEGPGRDGDST